MSFFSNNNKNEGRHSSFLMYISFMILYEIFNNITKRIDKRLNIFFMQIKLKFYFVYIIFLSNKN